MMEREDKLLNLAAKTDDLAFVADEFAKAGRQVR
jgi:hypothetical protein